MKSLLENKHKINPESTSRRLYEIFFGNFRGSSVLNNVLQNIPWDIPKITKTITLQANKYQTEKCCFSCYIGIKLINNFEIILVNR